MITIMNIQTTYFNEDIETQLNSGMQYVALYTHICCVILYDTVNHTYMIRSDNYNDTSALIYPVQFVQLSDTQYEIKHAIDDLKFCHFDENTPVSCRYFLEFIKLMINNDGKHPIIEDWIFAGTFK